jgi:hypothetical protein
MKRKRGCERYRCGTLLRDLGGVVVPVCIDDSKETELDYWLLYSGDTNLRYVFLIYSVLLQTLVSIYVLQLSLF